MGSTNIREVTLSNGEPRWEVRWSWYVDKDTRREKSRRFRTRPQAERFKHQVEAGKDESPIDAKDGKKTVAHWADLWLIHRQGEVARGRIRPSSLHGNEQVVTNTIKPMLGDRRVRSLAVDDIEAFIERVQIERGVTPATAKHHYGVLRQVLAFAVRKGAMKVNPADGARLDWSPAVNREPFEPVALDEAEVRALADAMRQHSPGTPWPLLVEFMAYTGLRAGEVAGLNVGDLRILGSADNIKRAEVHVRRIRVRGKGNTYDQPNLPKTGKVRKVPILPAWLRGDLAAYLAQHPHRDDQSAPLWPGATAVRGSGPKDWSSVPDNDKAWDRDPFYRRQFKPALKLAGLPPMRLHDLRHTAGSIMLAKGVPPYRVAEYLGHSVDVLLRIYASVLETDVAADMGLFADDARPVAVGGGVTRLNREA
jgi:integrase